MSVGQSLTRQDKTRQDKTAVVGCLDGVFESTNRVYSINGISPAITTCGGGNQETKIPEVKKIDAQSLRMVRTEEGKALRKAYESGEVHHGFNEYRTAEPRNDDVSNTITTVQKDNMILEQQIVAMRGRNPDNPFIDCEIEGVADLDYPSSETRRGRVINKGQISPTLTTENILSVIEFGNPEFYNFLYEIDGDIYLIRIRKLIPKECWRLMNFSDEDFEKAAEVNSSTQLYKQAGNSIVKNVLVAIMGQLFEGKEDVYKTV